MMCGGYGNLSRCCTRGQYLHSEIEVTQDLHIFMFYNSLDVLYVPFYFIYYDPLV